MMKNPYIHPSDLVSNPAQIEKIYSLRGQTLIVDIKIDHIDEKYLGLAIGSENLYFSLNRSIAYFGIDARAKEIIIEKSNKIIYIKLELISYSPQAKQVLRILHPGLYIGQLFALDPRRRVKSCIYIQRLLDKVDSSNEPLFSFGKHYQMQLQTKKKTNYINIDLPIESPVNLDPEAIKSMKVLLKGSSNTSININQVFDLFIEERKKPTNSKTVLYRTIPFSIKTLFTMPDPESLKHIAISNSANLITPIHAKDGITLVFHNAKKKLKEIPLCFYTQEPFREQFYFSERDRLKKQLEEPKKIFKIFEGIDSKQKSAIFIAKGQHFEKIKKQDWIESNYKPSQKLVIPPTNMQESYEIEEFIKNQPFYPIFKAIESDAISSEGVIFCTYFPAPIMKQFLLHEKVRRYVKAIYFKTPSFSYGQYFSTDDRAFLQDLAKANIAVHWVDFEYKQVLKYIMRKDNNSGMFIPNQREEEFRNATVFGIYGSSRLETNLKKELLNLFKGIKEMKKHIKHPKINANTSICIMTGGGPGIMSNGNSIANKLNILSCGNAVDFRKPHQSSINAEPMNPYIQAKMTYRLEQIIVRQSDFNVDFPIFFQGGIGTDLELCLEKLLMQIEAKQACPILLFGSENYWRQKISSQYKINLETGTIKGSEWISNSTFCVQTSQQALDIYHKFFTGQLKMGKDYPPNIEGFNSDV